MSDPSITPPIEAATVVLIRDGHASLRELEVLLLQRNERGFFGGMWVFPGGRVESEDVAEAPAHDVVPHCEPPHGTGSVDAEDQTKRGYRAAAVRETHEEASIVLDPDALVHHSHWLPPPVRPKRFSTQFFLCQAPPGTDAVRVDGTEIVDHAWVTPSEALAKRAAREIRYVTPTFVTLTYLARHGNAEAALAAAQPARCYHTELIDGPTHDPGFVAVYPGDAAYPDGDLDAPGPRRRCEMLKSAWKWTESGSESGPESGHDSGPESRPETQSPA